MKVNNKELLQSYVFTTARFDFSIYEKRIMLRLVELAQADLQNKKLDKTYIIGENLMKEKVVVMPLSSFLKDEKDKNYTQVKKALRGLRNKTVEYDDGNVWELIGIIEKPTFNRKQGTVTLEVNPKIWEAILNFSKGFRRIELKLSFSFESIYSARFYELFNQQKNPMTLTIKDLKKRFRIEDKYKNSPSNFLKKVIIPAKKELDEKSPYSFDYQTQKTGRKITSILFIPKYIPQNQDQEKEKKSLQMKSSSTWIVGKETKDYLMKNYGFDEKGLRSHTDLFESALKSIDLQKFLSENIRAANGNDRHGNKIRSKAGWIIEAIKNHLEAIEKKKTSKKSDDLIGGVADIFNAK